MQCDNPVHRAADPPTHNPTEPICVLQKFHTTKYISIRKSVQKVILPPKQLLSSGVGYWVKTLGKVCRGNWRFCGGSADGGDQAEVVREFSMLPLQSFAGDLT